jgi:hypothetical protein
MKFFLPRVWTRFAQRVLCVPCEGVYGRMAQVGRGVVPVPRVSCAHDARVHEGGNARIARGQTLKVGGGGSRYALGQALRTCTYIYNPSSRYVNLIFSTPWRSSTAQGISRGSQNPLRQSPLCGVEVLCTRGVDIVNFFV